MTRIFSIRNAASLATGVVLAFGIAASAQAGHLNDPDRFRPFQEVAQETSSAPVQASSSQLVEFGINDPDRRAFGEPISVRVNTPGFTAGEFIDPDRNRHN